MTTEKTLWISLLRKQLSDADAAGNIIEVCAVAGLLQRAGYEHDPTWCDVHTDAIDVAVANALRCVNTLEDRLVAVNEGDAIEEKLDALYDLDELCAALVWLGLGDLIASLTDRMARMIDAFPEPWADWWIQKEASLTLVSMPRVDPMRRVWEALEATAWSCLPASNSKTFDV